MLKTVAGKVSEGVMVGGWEKKRYEKKEIIFFKRTFNMPRGKFVRTFVNETCIILSLKTLKLVNREYI